MCGNSEAGTAPKSRVEMSVGPNTWRLCSTYAVSDRLRGLGGSLLASHDWRSSFGSDS